MIKGLYQNTNPENVPKGYGWYAKNVINNSLLDAVINEKGHQIIISGFETYNVDYFIGVAVYGSYIIFAYKTRDNKDQILLYNSFDNSKVIKLDRTDFNFNKNYPLDIEVKENQRAEIVLALTDNFNPPRYVNLENTTQDLNYYSLFPIYYNPSNMEVEILDSGSITSGAYIMYIQYITSDRTRSQYSIGSNPIYINNDVEGINSNQSTNKLIKVTLKDLDTTYDKIAIAVLSKINGIVATKVIKEINITNTEESFVYSGTEFLYDITLEDLLEVQPVYTKARHVTSINDQLFLADLESEEVINYQLLANAFVIDWISKLDTINKVGTSNKYKNGLNKTFLHDEVYAMYAQFELEGGRFTDWYHIPGRELTAPEKAVYPIENIKINGRDPYFYEIKDTCGAVQLLQSAGGIVTKYGQMGGWENTNETYSTSYGALSGQKVRHHKFPSIEFIANNVHAEQASYGADNLDQLGIKITNNLMFTPTYSKIIGYRVGYAKRTLSDVGVIGLGLSIFGASPSTTDGVSVDGNIIQSSAGNFNIICINGNPDDIMMNKNYLRFNSFDIWQDRPAIDNSYLRNYVKLRANKLASSAGGYAGGSTYGQIHPGSGSFDMVAYASNFTLHGANNAIKLAVTVGDEVRKLSGQKYIPNHIKVFEDSIVINNLGHEETLFAKIEGTNLALAAIGQLRTDTNNSTDDPLMGEEVYLSSLKNPKSDYFLDFENQDIVVNSTIFRSVDTIVTSNNVVVNGNFDLGLSNWSQTGAGTAWTSPSGEADVSLAAPGTSSAILYQGGFTQNTNYTFDITVTKTGSVAGYLVWLDASNVQVSQENMSGTGTFTVNTSSPTGGVKLGFRFQSTYEAGVVSIDNISILQEVTIDFNQLNSGDCFLGVYTYAMISAYNKNVDVNATETERVVNFKMHVNVGRHNVNYRYLEQGNYSSYFYPDAGKFTLGQNEVDKYWFYGYSRKSEWNKFLYSKDFSLVNDLEVYSVYDPTGLNESNFPYRIIKSTKPNKESYFEDGWRSFKPLDYYDTVRNKGEINNLESWGDILLIHHRDALFRTRDKAVLNSSDNLRIQLGSGDLFEIEPQEQNATKHGYAGTQHKFGCILTDIGYIFPDASRGEIYLFNGQLNNLSKGLKNFFTDYLYVDNDNPINFNGISIAYDQSNYRILLSLKGSLGHFTLSYDTIKQEWSSFHDYVNSYLFSSKNEVYSLKIDINNRKDVYLHGKGDYGKFYTGNVYPSFVDYVINDEPTKEKVLSAVNWLSKVYSAGVLDPNKTITNITIYNDRYTTGKVVIASNTTNSLYEDFNSNAKIVDGSWNFDDIYNVLSEGNYDFLESIVQDYRLKASALETNIKWFETEPMRGKYFIIRLEYSNLENNQINLYNIDALMRLSKS